MVDLELLEYLETFLTPRRKARFDKVLAQRTRHFTLATEDVYQLHNTSAVIRSCDVFGIQDIHVVEEVNTKRIDREIAMGAQKWVDVHRYNSVQDSIDHLRSEGYQIVATTPHTNDTELHDFDVTKKSCFFFGRETEGLSEVVLDQADAYLKIPMAGFTESLNISVSAAIILQHVTSQLKRTDVSWKLSIEDQQELRFHWIKKSLKRFDDILKNYQERLTEK
ncbi:TrmH family RNA methyltransferase [Gaetbulibacter aestuarii]|uniref:tRNA (guanosine(18)-2'-O)-methyltransferase n=1 Tax=Gaetbulibacter aestuarii TaxID=1502358 RepID=A0ABW7MYC2_9FLAO